MSRNRRVHALRLRWAALALTCAATLGGCGFHPLYGRQDLADGVGGPSINQRLSQIYVDPISERSGQLLRQALQARLGGDGDSESQTYRLAVAPAFRSEFVGIHGDNSPSRVRISGDARWSLIKVAAQPVLVATGHARALDGYNIINEQYFAASLAAENTNGRVARLLADGVVQQLALWMRAHPANAPVVAVSPAQLPKPQQVPPGFLNYRPVPGDNGQSSTAPVGADGMPAAALGLQAPLGAQ